MVERESRMHQKVSLTKIHDLIKSTKGRFFEVEFEKKNGEIRRLNGRTGVKIHRKTTDHKSYTHNWNNPYITVFDVQIGGYRSVNLDTILHIWIDKNWYTVNPN